MFANRSSYIKTRSANLGTSDEKLMPLFTDIAELFAPKGLIVILQLYNGIGLLATSVHVDAHDNGAQKALVRVEGSIAFYASTLCGVQQEFHSVDCDTKLSILRGADDTLGLEEPLGAKILNAGHKQAGRPALLRQLRSDGMRWPLEKKFSDQDCPELLKGLEDFIIEKTSNGALDTATQQAVAKSVLDATVTQQSVSDYLCKTLQPMIFDEN